jgi:hypothetical protein
MIRFLSWRSLARPRDVTRSFKFFFQRCSITPPLVAVRNPPTSQLGKKKAAQTPLSGLPLTNPKKDCQNPFKQPFTD